MNEETADYDNRLRWEVDAESSGKRLDIFLGKRLDIGRRQVKRFFAAGAVFLNSFAAKPGAKLAEGDSVEIRQPEIDGTTRKHPDSRAEQRLTTEGETTSLESSPERSAGGGRTARKIFVHLAGGRPVGLLYESLSAWVLDKPPGAAVLGGRRPLDRSFMEAIDKKTGTASAPERHWRFMHRLDRDTSGCLLLARTQRAAEVLRAAFENHAVKKEYLLVCSGRIDGDGGVIDSPLVRSTSRVVSGDVRRRSVVNYERGLPAVTEYSVIERFSSWTFVSVKTLTGRTHQVRVHFAEIGHPLAYDPLYGRKRKLHAGELNVNAVPVDKRGFTVIGRTPLHASAIEFPDPAQGRSVRIESPLPKDFRKFLDSLRKYARLDSR